MASSSQSATIELVTTVQAQLVDALGLCNPDPAAPSRLAGWSLGHVLTHIARHADSVVRRLDAAGRGQAVEQYPGGMAARVAEIEAGAARSWPDLLDDVVRSSDLLVDRAGAMPERAWVVESPAVNGMLQPASMVLRRRIREVALHHTDLGLGYEPSNWPNELLVELIVEGLPGLPARTDSAQLAGWLSGRSSAPVLDPFA